MKVVISSTLPQREARKDAADTVIGNRLVKDQGAVVRRLKGKKLRKGAKLLDTNKQLKDEMEDVHGEGPLPGVQKITMKKV